MWNIAPWLHFLDYVEDEDLPEASRGCWVGTGGNLDVTTEEGDRKVIANVPDSTFIDFVIIRQIHSTTTTASDIVLGW